MKKEIVMNSIKNHFDNKWTAKVKANYNLGTHGECVFEVSLKDFVFYVRWDYSTNSIVVSINMDVEKHPEICLKQMQDEDNPHYGNEHHLQLNGAKTKVQRIMHKQTWLSAPDGWVVEKEYDTVEIKAFFSIEELENYDFLKKPCGSSYYPSLSSLIIRLAKASKELYY